MKMGPNSSSDNIELLFKVFITKCPLVATNFSFYQCNSSIGFVIINPIALREAKIVHNFGLLSGRGLTGSDALKCIITSFPASVT